MRRLVAFLRSAAESAFGIVTLILGLAVLATVPVLQLLSLGYLLEVTGRVARSGRLRDGFVGLSKAARIGSIVLGTWLLLLPLRLLADFYDDARLIAADSETSRRLAAALPLVGCAVSVQLLWAWTRGGRLRDFLIPAPVGWLIARRRGRPRFQLGEFVASLRLSHYFGLGLRGLVGALVWLVIPASVLIVSTRAAHGPPAALIGLLGGLMLAAVLLYLPFLQGRLAAEGRFSAIFELAAVRREFRRAPIAYWIALAVTLAAAVPLYLLKIETVPSQVTWLPSLFFVMFIFPARLITGWSIARGRRRDRPRMFPVRWSARLAALPVVALYTLIVYFSQFISWNGAWNVFEQHAFLVPVPFLNL